MKGSLKSSKCEKNFLTGWYLKNQDFTILIINVIIHRRKAAELVRDSIRKDAEEATFRAQKLHMDLLHLRRNKEAAEEDYKFKMSLREKSVCIYFKVVYFAFCFNSLLLD